MISSILAGRRYVFVPKGDGSNRPERADIIDAKTEKARVPKRFLKKILVENGGGSGNSILAFADQGI